MKLLIVMLVRSLICTVYYSIIFINSILCYMREVFENNVGSFTTERINRSFSLTENTHP